MTSFQLKLIAIISMLIDHMGYLFFQHVTIELWGQEYQLFRIIVRIAFPIFAFLIVQGAVHTSNWKRYATRLFLFALISEVPFDFALQGKLFDISYQNVYFTLLLGLLGIHQVMEWEKKGKKYIGVVIFLFLGIVSEGLRCDYGMFGMLYILLCYFGYKRKENLAIWTIVYQVVAGGTQSFAAIAGIFIWLYNGKEGMKNKWIQYGFYSFYPVHLLVLAWTYYGMKG